MAVVAVIADNFRLDDAEAETDWQNIGGGPGGGSETDFFYQGSNCFARKGATSSRGINLLDGLSHDFDQVWQFDDSATAFVDETTDANSVTIDDWNFFPAGAGVNDYFAMGLDRTFDEITIVVSATIPGVGTYTITYEYWNGTAWVALSGVTDNTNNLKTSGSNTIVFTLPTDWEARVLNGSARLYYVRGIRDGGTVTTDPLGDTGDFTNVDNDLSPTGKYQTVMIKVICTTPGLLDLLSVPGIRLEVGSDGSNFHFYDVHGSDTYPPRDSWLISPIDPNIVSQRTGTTGTPVLTAARYYAHRYDQTGTSKSPNQALDAVDIGAGLTLTGGDGADPDGNFQFFVDEDEGTVANRWGYVITKEGILYVFGMLNIATSVATVFQDTGITIVFPDHLAAAGFSGITVDLSNATTDVDWTDCNFFGLGTEAGEDTRPVLTILGITGAFDATGCVFDAFAVLTLTSVCTLLNCIISNSEGIIQAGALIDGCTIAGATTADGVAFITSDNPANIKNGKFTFSDGHAIEITATGTYAFDGNQFTGYGADDTNDAAIYNNSGGAVTLNIGGGGSSPTVRNGAGASTTIVATVDVKIHVEDESGVDIQDAQVYIQKSTPIKYTSGAGNLAGDPDLVVTQTIDTDASPSGFLSVLDRSANETMGHRYASHDAANTFTFPAEVTFACTGGGTAIDLQDTVNSFLSIDIEEGDTIRNTTDGSWAVVDEITDADNIVTSPLQGGTLNVWTSGDFYSVHRLAVALESAVDLIDNPLLNGQSDVNGDAPVLAYDQAEAPTNIKISTSSSEGATKYITDDSVGIIDATNGFTLNVVLREDTVAV